MSYPTVPCWVLRLLLATGILLLAGVATSGGLAALVGLLGDAAGCRGLSWVAMGLSAALLADLICLLFALALYVLSQRPAPESPDEDSVEEEGGFSAQEPQPRATPNP